MIVQCPKNKQDCKGRRSRKGTSVTKGRAAQVLVTITTSNTSATFRTVRGGKGVDI